MFLLEVESLTIYESDLNPIARRYSYSVGDVNISLPADVFESSDRAKMLVVTYSNLSPFISSPTVP